MQPIHGEAKMRVRTHSLLPAMGARAEGWLRRVIGKNELKAAEVLPTGASAVYPAHIDTPLVNRSSVTKCTRNEHTVACAEIGGGKAGAAAVAAAADVAEGPALDSVCYTRSSNLKTV